MKKYLLSLAVAMMTVIGFTACSDNDDPVDENSLAKTTWVGKLIDEDEDFGNTELDVSLTFTDDQNGIEFSSGNLEQDGIKVHVEQYAKFSYTFDGKKGTAKATMITVKTSFGSETYVPDDEDSYIYFSYDSAKKTLTILDDDGTPETVLNKAAYKDIQFVTAK